VRLDFINEFNGIVASETTSFASTGGWQNWITTSDELDLPIGYFTMRMTITKPLFNMNWLEFTFLTSTENEIAASDFSIFPNPSDDRFYLNSEAFIADDVVLEIHDLNGRLVFQDGQISKNALLNYQIDIQGETNGIYIVTLKSNGDGLIFQRGKIFKL
jgi:hypothetical protein